MVQIISSRLSPSFSSGCLCLLSFPVRLLLHVSKDPEKESTSSPRALTKGPEKMDFSFGQVALPVPIIAARTIGNSDWPGFSSISSVRNIVDSALAKLSEYYRIRS